MSKCNITIYSSPTSWSSLAFKQFSNLWIIIYELLFIYLLLHQDSIPVLCMPYPASRVTLILRKGLCSQGMYATEWTRRHLCKRSWRLPLVVPRGYPRAKVMGRCDFFVGEGGRGGQGYEIGDYGMFWHSFDIHCLTLQFSKM